MKKRKEKMDELRAAKREGKIAYFIGSRLIIRNKPNSNSENIRKSRTESHTPPRNVSSLVDMFTPNAGCRDIGPLPLGAQQSEPGSQSDVIEANENNSTVNVTRDSLRSRNK